MLRTSLFGSGGRAPEAVLVTSTTSGEGKSLTCANLGIVLSRTEHTVAVVDADLRMPTMHKLFGIPEGVYPARLLDPKEAHLVADPAAVAHWGVPVQDNLTIFPAGPQVGHPSELLSSDRFVKFLQTVTAMYDYVLVDSPPVGAVTDASVLARQVDGVLFVVNYKFRTRRPAHGALKTLEQVGANVLGIVLNEAPAGRVASYGGYNAPVLGA